MNQENTIDYSAELAAEDEAIERISAELAGHDIPPDEIRDVIEKLHNLGTAVVEAAEYRIRRDPEEFYHLDWKKAA